MHSNINSTNTWCHYGAPGREIQESQWYLRTQYWWAVQPDLPQALQPPPSTSHFWLSAPALIWDSHQQKYWTATYNLSTSVFVHSVVALPFCQIRSFILKVWKELQPGPFSPHRILWSFISHFLEFPTRRGLWHPFATSHLELQSRDGKSVPTGSTNLAWQPRPVSSGLVSVETLPGHGRTITHNSLPL